MDFTAAGPSLLGYFEIGPRLVEVSLLAVGPLRWLDLLLLTLRCVEVPARFPSSVEDTFLRASLWCDPRGGLQPGSGERCALFLTNCLGQ